MKTSFRALISTLMLLSCALTTELRSQGNAGFGIIVGEPTGVAFKYRMDGVNAVDGAGIDIGIGARFYP